MTKTWLPALESWGDYDLDDPFPLFAEVLAAGPVHDVVLKDGVRAFLVVSYDAAREALNHPGLSKDMEAAMDAASEGGDVVSEGLPGRDFARHMLSVDPPDHSRMRGLATPGFTKSRLSGLEGRINDTVSSLLDSLEAVEGPVDLVEGFALPLPFSVIGELLGIDAAGQQSLVAWFATLMAPYSGATPPPEAVAASDGIVSYLNDLVDRRLAAPTEDLVGDLARSANAGTITRKELLSSLFQLIVAGHHTTTSLIGNGVAALLADPTQLEALVAEPDLIPKAIEEFLRYDAPVPHSTFRYATSDVVIAGTAIPAGVQVIVNLAAAGRDPSRHDDPDVLDVRRASTDHLAFGHGIHHCLGARLARLEALIAFRALLGRFPGITLAVDPSELHWNHGDGLVLRGLSSLPVHLR